MTDISIIVPIYNAEKYIEKCIESLINQTKKELEFILVNDGSTDNTEELIKKYKDKRIKYFKNKNQGIGKTRNFGIEKSNSKYIMFLDSDDYLDPKACELLYNKAVKENLDVVICDYIKLIGKDLNPVIIEDFKNTTLKNKPSLIRKVNLSPWNKIYKSELIKKNNIKFIENLKYEDVPFVIESLEKANKIGKVNKCLNYYVIHGNSETTVRDKRVFDILKIVDIVRKYLKNKTYIKTDLDKLTVRIITNYTIQTRCLKDKKLSKKFINEAFDFLKTEVPNYKNNMYYENRSFLQRTIEKNKLLTTLYCKFYK